MSKTFRESLLRIKDSIDAAQYGMVGGNLDRNDLDTEMVDDWLDFIMEVVEDELKDYPEA